MIRLSKAQAGKLPGGVKSHPARPVSAEQAKALKLLGKQNPQRQRESQKQELERLYRKAHRGD